MRHLRYCMIAALAAPACSDYELYVHDGADIFYQDPPSEVDILLVVDDSCSMEPYQLRLSENFSEFIQFFVEANVDYHIGVVTTDVSGFNAGALRGQIINTDTPDASAVFANLVRVGSNGSGSEMGLEAAALALSEPNISTVNAGFLRPEASLSVLFVSDEEDYSPWPVNNYINNFLSIKGSRQRDVFNASALVVDDINTCPSTARGNSTRGTRYMDVVNKTGGVRGDICAESFAGIITDLSLNASRLMDTFYLSDPPLVETLEVRVNDEILPCEDGAWTYALVVNEQGVERPAVVFDRAHLPPPSSQIAIRYDFGGGDPAGFCTSAATP